MEYNIVIPVYNRLASYQRLINRLLNADITGVLNVYVSCDGNTSKEILDHLVSKEFPFGKFEVIRQTSQLGVDAHNLACMRMAEKLGHVIVIEDDLIVSPYFQGYLNACKGVMNEPKLAGISLYRYPIIEQDHFPFNLVPNDEFVYYQQRPSSKGCFYTWEMLKPYFDFLKEFDGDFSPYHLPKNVQNWGDEVWEKSFYCYLQKTDKYLAFPRFSLTTDFADDGVHMNKQTLKYVHQSPLHLSDKFGSISGSTETLNVYDAFYELLPTKVKGQFGNSHLDTRDFTMDINGHKDLNKIKTEYLISSKPSNNKLMGWDRRLKPEINNILLHQEGDFYMLAKTKTFSPKSTRVDLKEKFLYYFPDTKLIDLIRMKWQEVISRLFKNK